MSLSRKRRRELKKLRSHTEDLIDEQREVLERAGTVLHEATRQAKKLSDEHVAPRVDEALESIRPQLDRGVASARRTADRVRLFTAPLVAGALASTVKTLDRIESRDTAKQLRTFAEQRGLMKPEKKRRAGSIFAIGLGVAAAVGVGYALWQAFRTDDEMWVSPAHEE